MRNLPRSNLALLHRDVLFLARFLQVLLFSCKIHARFSFIWVCYFLSATDKIQAPKRFLFLYLSEREHSNFVQVKGHFFSIFPKLGQENLLNKQINLNCLRAKKTYAPDESAKFCTGIHFGMGRMGPVKFNSVV